MQTVIIIVHVLASLGVIGLVLLQQGKGADAGAAFGSGASATVFGARGSGSFLTRTTAILATVFFVTSLSLAYFAGRSTAPASVTEMVAPVASEVPAAPAAQQPAAQDKPDLPAPKQ